MKIKRSELVEMIKSVIKEETEYQKFFKATLEKEWNKEAVKNGDLNMESKKDVDVQHSFYKK